MKLIGVKLMNYNELRDRYEGDVDVYVKVNDSVYFAVFQTFNNLRIIIINNQEFGEFLHGKYIPSSSILIEEITYELVEKVINDMLKNETFDEFFSLVDSDNW